MSYLVAMKCLISNERNTWEHTAERSAEENYDKYSLITINLLISVRVEF
jgi:hypothetical protein